MKQERMRLNTKIVEDNGKKFEGDDLMREELQSNARAGGANLAELLSTKMLFGDDLRDDKRFVQETATAMEDLPRDGILKTLPR